MVLVGNHVTQGCHSQFIESQVCHQVTQIFEEEDSFYLFMECMYRGDLCDHMIHQTKHTKHDAHVLAQTLLEVVAYLHEQQIAHCDLKLQNIMLQSDDDLMYWILKLLTLALPVMFICHG